MKHVYIAETAMNHLNRYTALINKL